MWTPTSTASAVRGVTFALWALAAAGAVYWGLKLGGGGRSVAVPEVAPRAVPAADPAAIAALLGSTPAAAAVPQMTPLATRFQLLGVVAGVSSGDGAAVISVDGRPARSFRVGASIDQGVVLHSVQGRRAVLADGNGGELVTLELPARSLASPTLPAPPPVVAPTPVPPPAVPAQVPTPMPARGPMGTPAQAPTAAPR